MKKKNHIEDSEAAFALFLQWKGVAKPLEKMQTALGKSSASEDDVSFSSKLQRPFHWHFYNNNNLIADNDWIPGQRTSEKRFKTLLEKLGKYIDTCKLDPDRHNIEDLVEVTGRLMHHIQDMSTPSHVVPVYHGPGVSDHYETYIENYAGKIIPRFIAAHGGADAGERLKADISTAEIDKAIGQSLDRRGANPMMDLYESSAQATLKFLKENSLVLYCDGAEKSYPLTVFWQENDGSGAESGKSLWLRAFSKGFGSFGLLGNNFGKLNFSVGNKFYEGSPDEYLRVYKKLYEKTLVESIVVLEFVARKSKIFTNAALVAEALNLR